MQEALKRDPHGGDLFVFRGKRGKLIKVLWHDGQGMCLFAKRLERGRFVWPSTLRRGADRTVTITPAQLGYLLEGIDWRNPQHSLATIGGGLSATCECDRADSRCEFIRESHRFVIQLRVATTPDQLPDDDDALKAALIETRAKLSGARGADRAPAIGDRQDEARDVRPALRAQPAPARSAGTAARGTGRGSGRG